MNCWDCNSSDIVIASEIYQDCIQPKNQPERCIALIVPVAECRTCGARMLTDEALELIERAHFDAM